MDAVQIPGWAGGFIVVLILIVVIVLVVYGTMKKVDKTVTNIDITSRNLGYASKFQNVKGNYCSNFEQDLNSDLSKSVLNMQLPKCDFIKETHIEYIKNPTTDPNKHCYSRVCETKPQYRGLI